MDDVLKLYHEGKLLVRTMDQPTIRVKKDTRYYECDTWTNEFNNLDSNQILCWLDDIDDSCFITIELNTFHK